MYRRKSKNIWAEGVSNTRRRRFYVFGSSLSADAAWLFLFYCFCSSSLRSYFNQKHPATPICEDLSEFTRGRLFSPERSEQLRLCLSYGLNNVLGVVPTRAVFLYIPNKFPLLEVMFGELVPLTAFVERRLVLSWPRSPDDVGK